MAIKIVQGLEAKLTEQPTLRARTHIPFLDWNEAKGEATELVEQASKWAVGLDLDGEAVADTEPQYENNAKYYAEQMAATKTEAERIAQSVRDDADAGLFKGDPGYTPIKGVDYFDGEKGEAGVGIASITLTSGDHEAGTFDTYTIIMTDGTTTDIMVYNGANGEGVGDMLWANWKAIYDPQNKMEDIFGQKGVSSWNDLTDKPELFDGDYNSLTNKPTIPTVPTADINANTSARHTHNNKAVLDGITADKVSEWDGKASPSDIPTAEINANTSARHTHNNKIVLDAITSDKVTEWNSKSTFSGNYDDLENKPNIPDAVTDEHINGLIDAKTSTIKGGGIIVQNTAPEGDSSMMWIDTASGGIAKYWNGSAWVTIKAVWG